MYTTKAQFTRVENRKRPDNVVSQLAAALQDGSYAVGDRLPPERALALQMGVSRTSVREALALLSLEGIVERRVGSGTYVCSTDPAALARATSALQEAEDPYEVFEWQQVVEPAVTAVAIGKLTSEDHARLAAALHAMRAALERGDRRVYSQADRQFHLAIAEAADNELAMRQMTQLFEWMAHQSWLGLKRFAVDESLEADYFRGSLAFHEELYQAIVARDQAAVYASYQSRYQRIRDIIFGGTA